MPRLRALASMVLSLSAACFPAFAESPPEADDATPTPPSVSVPFGVVREASGNPIAGATVDVLARGKSERSGVDGVPEVRRGSATTDEQGEFLVADVDGTVFDILVRKKGFAPRFARNEKMDPVLEIELERGDPVEGIVLEARTARPIAGATVRVEDGTGAVFGLADAQATVTGDDGRFRFPNCGGNAVKVLAVAPGFAAELSGARPGKPEGPTFRLRPGRPVRGRVVDTEGNGVRASVGARAIEGAEASVEFRGRRSDGLLTHVVTDRDGRFAFDGLPSGAIYELRPGREDRGTADPVRVEVPEGTAAIEDVRLVLPEATGVRFVLVAPPPAAVDEVEAVIAARPRENGGFYRVGRARSVRKGDDGAFVATGLPEGSVRLRIHPVGWLPVTVSDVVVEAGATTDLGELEVLPGAVVEGTVRDAAGDAVVDAHVRLAWEHEGSGFSTQTGRTDETGAFRIRGVQPGATLAIRVKREGFEDHHRPSIDPAEGPIEIVLERRATLAGKVVLEEGGTPAGFRVRVYPVPGKDQPRRWAAGPRPAADERFEAVDTFEISGFGAGVWNVEVTAPGRVATMRESIEVDEGERADAGRFELGRGLHVAGTVIDEGGAPVGGAGVTVRTAGGFMGASSFGPDEDPDSAFTAADGRFRIEGLEPGRHVARATHTDYADASVDLTLEPDGSRDDLELTLDAGGTVEGAVRDRRGEPVAGARVGLFAGMDFDGGRTAQTGPDGRYRIERVTAGTYRMMAQTDPESPGKRAAVNMKSVTVTSGETSVVDFDETAGITVRGTLRRGSDPIPGADMMWVCGDVSDLSNVNNASSDESGRFEIRIEAPGACQVRVSARDASGGATRVVVPEGDDVELDVELPSGAIVGSVRDENGDPVDAASVQAMPERSTLTDMMMSARAETDAGGSFRVEGLLPGTYRVVASKDGFAPSARPGVVLPESGEAPPIDLVLRTGTTVRGRVVDPGGRPVAGALVFVGAAGSDQILANGMDAMTDRNGVFVIRGAPRGTLSAAALSDGLAPGVVEGWVPTESPDDDDVVVIVGRGGTLHVRVVGPDGEPRAGVVTSLRAERFGILAAVARMSNFAGPSDANGLVVIGDLTPGAYTVLAPGAEGVRAEVVEGAVTEVTVVVPD